mgnify:CR=1 FL=1
MTDFLKFEEYFQPKDRKTKMFKVVSAHSGDYLGLIYWRNGWRRYVMSFESQTDWSIECMAQCYKFVQKLMDERKKVAIDGQKH